MNIEYKRFENEVAIKTDGHLICRDNHKNVARELELENEIEMLQAELKQTEDKLSECNHKNLLHSLGVYVFSNIVVYMYMSWLLGGNVMIYRVNFVACLLAVFDVIFLIQSKIQNPFLVGKRRKKLKLRIEYLKHSLEKCKSELNELKINKDLIHVSLDESVVSLTEYNISYRNSLEKKLELLAKIKIVKQHIADGILTQYMKENFEADEIEFVKEYIEAEARKRVK